MNAADVHVYNTFFLDQCSWVDASTLRRTLPADHVFGVPSHGRELQEGAGVLIHSQAHIFTFLKSSCNNRLSMI